MNDVAIIGVGLHPFGRFEGKSAMQMGVDAIFAAVADAGHRVERHPGRHRRQLDRGQPGRHRRDGRD